MQQLTPELVARSQLTDLGAGATDTEYAALEFGLARRSAIVINKIVGEIMLLAQVAAGAGQILQQLSLDPDETTVELTADTVVIDSAYLFSQAMQYQVATAEASQSSDRKVVEWGHLNIFDRPITIRDPVHIVQGGWGARTDTYTAILEVYYIIVELSLSEIGYINASRR